GSWVGEVPWPDIAAYCVSKAGVRMLARSMARELAEHGIRVNVVAPGIVWAGMARRQFEADPAYARRASGVIPLGEFGTPEQVADLDLLVITHSDLDHQALAWIRAMSGEAEAVDVGLAGGGTIRLGPGFELRVLHVPGHSPGHLALHDERSGAVFAGDCVQGS